MTGPHGWSTAHIVHGLNLDKRSVPVVVGLVRPDGRAQVAVRVGEHGDTVILSLAAARQLLLNLHAVLDERRDD